MLVTGLPLGEAERCPPPAAPWPFPNLRGRARVTGRTLILCRPASSFGLARALVILRMCAFTIGVCVVADSLV